MIHHASPDFWRHYGSLSPDVRALADKAFALLKPDARHSTLQLKKAGKFWSARVGLHYRVLGIEVEDGVLWFWIGSHAEYDRLLS